MNKIHKVIFCTATQTWVAVSEIAKSRGKSRRGGKSSGFCFPLKTLSTALLLIISQQAQAACTLAGNGAMHCGENATVVGENATAVGKNAKAKANRATAIGEKAMVTANQSDLDTSSFKGHLTLGTTPLQGIAIGSEAASLAYRATAIGENAGVNVVKGIAIGTYAYAHKETGLVGRSGQAAVYNNKKMTPDAVKSNLKPHQTGYGAVAIGPMAQAYGAHAGNKIGAISVGAFSQAKGGAAMSFGARAAAMEDETLAIGAFSIADKKGGVALGAFSNASRVSAKKDDTYVGYHALGKDVSTDKTGTWVSTLAAVSVGNAGDKKTRQIIGVAAGTKPTDAVNVAQLKAAQTHYFSVNDTGKNRTYDKKTDNKANDGGQGRDSLAAGKDVVTQGRASTITGYSSSILIDKAREETILGVMKQQVQALGAVSTGAYNTMNTDESKIVAGSSIITNAMLSQNAMANVTTGVANTATNANAAIMVGSGNQITNSMDKNGLNINKYVIENLGKAFIYRDANAAYEAAKRAHNQNPTAVTEAALAQAELARRTAEDELVEALVRSATKDGELGSVGIFGGANKANEATRAFIAGIRNEYEYGDKNLIQGYRNKLKGTADELAERNFVSGNENTATNVNDLFLAGSYNTVTNADENVVLGNHNKLGDNEKESQKNIIMGFRTQQGKKDKDDKIIIDYSVFGQVNNSQIIGSDVTVTADKSSKITNVALSDGLDYAVALGDKTIINKDGGVALGAFSEADRAASTGATRKDFGGYNVITDGYGDGGGFTGITATHSKLAAVSVGAKGKTRQIINLAAGTEDSDAVNVSQLRALRKLVTNNAGGGGAPTKVAAGNNITVTRNGDTYTVATDNDVSFDNITVGDVVINKDSGIDAGNKKIQNVAPGKVSPTSTDTINGSQLYHSMQGISNNLNNHVANLYEAIGDTHDSANAGAASAMAAASLPQPHDPGANMVSAAVGTYNGQSALSVGVSAISDNGKWIIKGALTHDTQSNTGASVGVGYQW